MITYGLRLRFHISNKGMIPGDDKEIDFVLPNGDAAIMKCLDAEKFSDSAKFVVISGGYSTREEALECANKLKDAVLYFGVKFGLGIDVGKDAASGGISKYLKDKILDESGMKMINDVHGITIYSEEHPTSFVSASASGLTVIRDSKFFTIEVCNLLTASNQVNNKTKLAMELLLSSRFESSTRARFLTLILAAESILIYEDRSVDVKKYIDKLKMELEKSTITEDVKKSIKGTLGHLYKDSISQSLRKMAIKHLQGKTYNNVSAEAFIKECYDARSKLVHEGSVDDSKHNIGNLANILYKYMTDMLTTISHI